MFAVSPQWLAAHDAVGKQLTVLVELLGLGRTLANVATPAGPTAELVLLSVQAGSIGEVTNTLDPWSGLSQISQVQVQVSNATGFARTLGPTFRKSAVRLRLGIGALTTLATFLPLFTGHVEQVEATGPVCTITLVPGAFAWHRDLSVLLGDVFFTVIDEAISMQAIPLLVGRNIDVTTLPVTATVVGHLAVPLGADDLAMQIHEFSARFPRSGTVTVGDALLETIPYTTREIVTTGAGSTVLLLSGLTRAPSAFAHGIGELVALQSPTWLYLIGYQCTVLAVRRDGQLLAPTFYTVAAIPVPGSPLPVTALEFTASQAGTVLTVDVDGSNIAPSVDPIVNGGFETGDTTGWTVTGATATVTTGATPDDSTYKCELVGGFGAAGTLSQTFPVTVGRAYVLTVPFALQPATLASPVTNPDFATGDATGWTVTLTTSHPELTMDTLYGVDQIPVFAGVRVQPDAAGSAWAAFRDGTFTYQARWEQVVTVTASTLYRYTFAWVLQAVQATPGLPPTAQAFSRSSIVLELINEATGTVFVTVSRACYAGLERDQTTQTFTTTGTSLRIRITADGLGYRYPPPLVQHGGILLAQASNTSWPTGHLTLGTPTQPTAYLDQALQAGPGVWWDGGGPFVATEDDATLALRTQYDLSGLPAALWLDNLRLEEEGRHPVEVIRWVIETFLPGLTINTASFQAAYLARAAWRCGGQWRDPGDSRALLTHLADQFELRYFENGIGEACLVPIATQPETSALRATVTPQTARAFTPSGEPPTQLATDLYVYYNPRRGAGGQNPADYGAVVYATPEATTGDPAWQVACHQVQTVHGIRQTLRYFAEAIQDQVTAHLKLAALVDRYTTLGTLVQCTDLSLRDTPLEIGDVIAMQHPVLGDLPQVGEVLGVAVDLSTPALTLTARLTAVLGTEERYEAYEALITEGTEEAYPDLVLSLGSGTEEGYTP